MTILQPAPCGEQPAEIDEFDADRAQEYSLLAMLLAVRQMQPRSTGSPSSAVMRRRLASRIWLLRKQRTMRAPERIAREYFNLFIGVGRGELLPYGSYYLTGFLNERPLARLREDLRAHGIERAEGQVEPEDHAAILCEIMAGMASGQFSDAAGCSSSFSKNISPLGLVVSSLIWNEPRRPSFIVRWESSAGSSWRPRRSIRATA